MRSDGSERQDPEAPESDAFEQSLAVAYDEDGAMDDGGSPDPEVPGVDAFEQHQPAPVDDEAWR